MDARSNPSDRDAAMARSNDPRSNRASMSTEAGPSRCHMESSFYSILHSSGFAEWAARAEAQNDRYKGGSWSRSGHEAGPPASADSKSSRESSSPHSAYAPPKPASARSQKLERADGTSSKTRSKNPDEPVDEEEEEGGGCPTERFTAHYTNYTSMDAELNILKKHLMQREGF